MISLPNSRPSGLTLIELIVVITIMSIIVGTVTVSLQGPLQNIRLESTIERIIEFDRLQRRRANRFGVAGSITIDLDNGAIFAIADGHQDGEQNNAGHTLRLDSGLRIGQVWVERHRFDYGAAKIDFDSTGRANTYAIRLDRRGGTSEWILFPGVTGQPVRIDNDSELTTALRYVTSPGTNPY